MAAWTDELDAATAFNSESTGLVSHILNCQVILASQRAICSRDEEMQRFRRYREEMEVLATKAALLERQVGELTAARDEAIVPLRHAQTTHESALATLREKAEATETSWHAAHRAQAQLVEQLAAAQRDYEVATLRADAEERRAESVEVGLTDFCMNPLKDADMMGELAYYLTFADAICDLKKANLPSAP